MDFESSNMNVNIFLMLLTCYLLTGCMATRDISGTEKNLQKEGINHLLEEWHEAAANADEGVFFGSMTADGIYIGTDSSEYWLRDELRSWSSKYFDKESAWIFKPTERNIYLDSKGSIAWFDELLDTWMGACRGSGVLEKQPDDTWKIKHYHLSIAVPNDVVKDYLDLLVKDTEE